MICDICKQRPATGQLYDPPSFITLPENAPVCDECAEAEFDRQMNARMDDNFRPRGKFAEIFGSAA